MSQYAARVMIPKRNGATVIGQQVPFTMEEILVEGIKAGSQKKAKQKALAVADRHIGYRFPLAIERDEVPSAKSIEVVRLNAIGEPVNSKFKSTATTHVRPLANDKGGTGATYKGGGKPRYKHVPPVVYPFTDPITDQFITSVMEK